MNPKGGNINVDVLPHDYVKFIRVVFDVRGNVGSTAETTIRKYKVALDVLLETIPEKWKYILVYQNENENSFKIFEDHIEVYITNNLSDYGNFVGVNMLLELNIIPCDSWFLFIHDTCKFLGDECVELTNNLIKTHDTDILWLCDNGQCNICLIRENAIKFGNNIYKDIVFLTKMETIALEWNHGNPLSPKSFNVKQQYINTPTKFMGTRQVYSSNERHCILFESINMEKYYFYVIKEEDHPFNP